MDAFKAKYITYLISFTLVTGAGIGALLYYVFPAYYPQWYTSLLIFFFLYECFSIFVVDRGSKKLDQRKLANLYMLIKVAKVLLSLAFVTVYALVVKEGIKSFVLIFMLFYFLFLLFETFFISHVEKRKKAQNTIDK